jgi:hypothetical protein
MENKMTNKDPRRIETGFVGFFDILGYKSFLESGITELTFKVIGILGGLSQRVSENNKLHKALCAHMGNYFAPDHPASCDLRWELERVKTLIVSDSILLWSSYEESRDRSKRPGQAATFLVTASVLERLMFEEGLPVRGAITFGDFIVVENVFAGKPIVQAYTLGQSLDLAACAIHPTAESQFKTLLTIAPDESMLQADGLPLVRYPVPTKTDRAGSELLCLNLAWPTLSEYPPLKDRPNPRRYIEEKFSAHGKQVGRNAISKVENTEKFLRFLAHQFPYLFTRDP